MILQKDMPLFEIAEVWPITIFAICYQSIPHLIVTLVFQEFDSVEPMFHMIAIDNYNCSIPTSLVNGFTGRSRNKVVELTKLSVAFHAQFSIGMAVIIKHLEFTTD